MKKITYLLITTLALTLTACGSVSNNTDEPEVTEEILYDIEKDEAVAPEVTPEPEEPEAPDYVGSWRITTGAGDGTKFVLEVYINPDGSARYKAGPPYSEFMVDAKGTWTAQDDTITLDLYDTIEGFSWRGTYKWAMDGNALALTHTDGDAFLYGTEGTTIVFNRK